MDVKLSYTNYTGTTCCLIRNSPLDNVTICLQMRGAPTPGDMTQPFMSALHVTMEKQQPLKIDFHTCVVIHFTA